MNDDYKRGLVTGLAMHPLCVTIQHTASNPDVFCDCYVDLIDTVSDDSLCDFLNETEE